MTTTIDRPGNLEVPPELLFPEIENDLTRREFLIGMGSLLLLAPGCGSGEQTANGGDASGGRRTIEHKFGTTEIQGTPERVVSLGFTEQDAIYALGVKPVAVRYAFGDKEDAIFPWAEDEAGDTDPEILNMPFGELNFEKIAVLQPDLILGVTSGITAEEYETLSQIAPTVAQSGEYVDFGTPWQEMTTRIGRALGKEDRAKELVADVEARFARARQQYPDLEGATVTLSGPALNGEYPFHASEDTRTRFLTALGLEVPAELDKIAGEKFFGTVSRERAELLDNDLIIWQVGSSEERAAIEADPILQQLDAVRAGRAVFLAGDAYDALQFTSVLSLPFLLDGVALMLAAAVDGDPETEVTSAS